MKSDENEVNKTKTYKPDSREHTSDVIHHTYRRKRLEGNFRLWLVFLASILIGITGIAFIGILQYDEYFAFINDRSDYIINSKNFCTSTTKANIEYISTSIAGALLIFYVILYKRRIYLREKFKYRNIGLPMITSLWSKKDRFFYSLVFGLIAFNIFNMTKNYLQGNKNTDFKMNFKDPSGIIPLLIKIATMLLIGIRYYPVLVGNL